MIEGYPLVECPDCGDTIDVDVVSARYPDRAFGPGEWAVYACGYCGTRWDAVVPEPPDGYEGDGIFAETH